MMDDDHLIYEDAAHRRDEVVKHMLIVRLQPKPPKVSKTASKAVFDLERRGFRSLGGSLAVSCRYVKRLPMTPNGGVGSVLRV